jgi:hypothetical protein
VLKLPPDATVTQVLSDNEPLTLRPEHGELSLAALPGSHTWSVDWRTNEGASLLTRSSRLGFEAPASNLSLTLKLPEDRWVLFVWGGGVGPTVLYWGELLVFVVLALLVGRSRLTHVATREWLLLGLGLSTFSWLALGAFALFIAVFEWRARGLPWRDARRFNLLQVILALLALLATLSLVAAVPQGLLARPDMRISPTPSGNELSWFIDAAHGALPLPAVVSVSLWWYKLAMLGWALWLSFALTRWLRWAWQVFARDGLWMREDGAATASGEGASA